MILVYYHKFVFKMWDSSCYAPIILLNNCSFRLLHSEIGNHQEVVDLEKLVNESFRLLHSEIGNHPCDASKNTITTAFSSCPSRPEPGRDVPEWNSTAQFDGSTSHQYIEHLYFILFFMNMQPSLEFSVSSPLACCLDNNQKRLEKTPSSLLN